MARIKSRKFSYAINVEDHWWVPHYKAWVHIDDISNCRFSYSSCRHALTSRAALRKARATPPGTKVYIQQLKITKRGYRVKEWDYRAT